MKYGTGSLGRVFVARLEDGDDLLKELTGLLNNEKVDSGVAFIIGALKEARMVVGPKEAVIPPDPVWKSFDDGREILAIATAYRENGEIALHMHAAVGRGEDSLTGCIREMAETYLTLEIIIMEINGTGACRKVDVATGLKLLDFIDLDSANGLRAPIGY